MRFSNTTNMPPGGVEPNDHNQKAPTRLPGRFYNSLNHMVMINKVAILGRCQWVPEGNKQGKGNRQRTRTITMGVVTFEEDTEITI